MRYLKRNHATRLPSRLVFWDVETHQRKLDDDSNGRENVFRLGCASRLRLAKGEETRRSVLRFNKTSAFWDWIEETADPKSQTFVFAHNLAFDATVSGLWLELDKGRFRLSDSTSLDIPDDPRNPDRVGWTGFLCREDPPTIIKVRNSRQQTFTFVDTLNYFKTSLANLGDRIGLEKLDMPAFDAPDADWYVYCERDVEVIERTMINYIQWIRDNDLGNFKLTAPSQAFAAFNHRFRKPEILVHSKPEVQSLERESYYGGRLESFYIGNVSDETGEYCGRTGSDPARTEPETRAACVSVDVNSLYPSVMLGRPYPTGLETHKRFESPVRWNVAGLCHRCIADVHLNATETFPRRLPGVGIVFGKGQFRTTLCGPELMRAVRGGHVSHVYEFARYSLKPLFTDYVEFFWDQRLQAKLSGDVVGNLFCKLFLNSLYGKFGQLTSEWEETGKSPDGIRWKRQDRMRGVPARMTAIHDIAGVRYLQHKRTDHPNSFCAVAAWVTAYARERMLELMNIAGDGEVFYIVTDGLFVSQLGFDRLNAAGEISDLEIGKLSLKDSCRRGWLGGVHWYNVGETVKQGSNKRKAVVLTTGHALQEKWERLAGVLSRGPTDTVRIWPQIKKYARDYRRGIVQDNGDVIPFTYAEPLEDSSSVS